jgi:hypothetical protein
MRFEIPAAGGRQELVIEAVAAANINYFLKTNLTPKGSSTAVNKQVSVKGHQRRSFPGDAITTSVSATGREYLADAGAKSGNGLGGFTFTLTADAGLPGEEKRAFTLVRGRVMDLHSYLVANAKYQTQLKIKGGARYVIDAAGGTVI